MGTLLALRSWYVFFNLVHGTDSFTTQPKELTVHRVHQRKSAVGPHRFRTPKEKNLQLIIDCVVQYEIPSHSGKWVYYLIRIPRTY